MYELEFTTYESGFWEETASILRDQLASAYIDLSVTPTQFSTLTERGRNGDHDAYTLGWGMDYPWVTRPRFGGAGPASQKLAKVSIDDRD